MHLRDSLSIKGSLEGCSNLCLVETSLHAECSILTREKSEHNALEHSHKDLRNQTRERLPLYFAFKILILNLKILILITAIVLIF